MTLVQAILLGVVQGLTEFLPISSSAHLVLVPELLGWNLPAEEAFVFFVLVQWGTLFAVIAYFWAELWPMGLGMLRSLNPVHRDPQPAARLGWLLVLATLPVMLGGLLLKAPVEAAFTSPRSTGLFLLATAALLTLAEGLGRRARRVADVGAKGALVIGCFQILALFPGISRSGATISGGMLQGLRRPAAARFAFLMAVPALIAAGALELFELSRMPNALAQLGPLLAGMLAAGLVGYLSIRWLLNYIARHSYYVFAAYCMLVGSLAALFA